MLARNLQEVEIETHRRKLASSALALSKVFAKRRWHVLEYDPV
jgi:hypothetical protein